MTDKKFTASDIVELLRDRYRPDAYALLTEIPNATGASCNSRIDAAAFGLWPSKGLHRIGMEIKVSRADFLRELQDPKKNEWARKYFHEFWFVTGPKVVADVSEIPQGDGWMTVHGKALSIKRHANRRQDASMDDGFVASLARSMVNGVKNEVRMAFRDDPMAKRGQVHIEAVSKFLTKRFVNPTYADDTDAVVAKLEEASASPGEICDRKDVLGALDAFQERMGELFQMFLVLANESLLARDEAGRRVVGRWGGVDAGCVKELSGRARQSIDRTRILQMRDMLNSMFPKEEDQKDA